MELLRIVGEEAGLLAVIAEEMLGGDFKGFLHPLTDSDTGNNNDELAPAITAV